MKSEQLRIRVSENGRTKVDLTFRSQVVENLDGLIPGSLRPSLEERHIDLEMIARKAVESDFAPGNLFSLEEGPKQVTVWLE